MASLATAGTIPLIVGVTGHRDVHAEHVPALAAALAAEFALLRERYPHSSLVLLSPLAEGADRVAARVAVEQGVRLIVPLPMPLELYQDDFETAGSQAEFRHLLERAEARIDLPLLPGSTVEAVRRPGMARDREYAKVGAYVANFSHVFVACWDGVTGLDDTLLGGTGRTVQLRLKGAPYIPRSSRLAPLDSGAVVHIVTPRGTGSALANAFSRSVITPPDRSEASIDRLLTRLDAFNRDVLLHQGELATATEQSKAYLLHAGVSAIDDAARALPPSCQAILDRYASADALSVLFGGRTIKAWKHVFLGAFVAGVLLNLHASLYYYGFLGERASVTGLERLAAAPWALLGSLAMSAFTALWLHRKATTGEYQEKHQDYRALAEALRVQFFWLVAGISEPVVIHYLQKHRSDLEWIRSALYASTVLMNAQASDAPAVEQGSIDGTGVVRRLWIADQRAYYTKRVAREQRQLARERAIGGRLFTVSVVTTGLFASVLSLPLVYPAAPLTGVRLWVEYHYVAGSFEFLIVFFALAAAMMLAYSDQMARAAHIRQFGRIGELFAAAEQALAERQLLHEPDRSAEVIVELGKEALDEAGDWLILHRDRPFEVPHG